MPRIETSLATRVHVARALLPVCALFVALVTVVLLLLVSKMLRFVAVLAGVLPHNREQRLSCLRVPTSLPPGVRPCHPSWKPFNGTLTSEHGGNFTPDFIWKVRAGHGSAVRLWGGYCVGCATSHRLNFSSTVTLGFCARARMHHKTVTVLVDGQQVRRVRPAVECLHEPNRRPAHPPMPGRGGPLEVIAWNRHYLWQHVVLDAVPSLGMAAVPLLAAGYNVSASGQLRSSNLNVLTRPPPPSLTFRETREEPIEVRNLVLPVPSPGEYPAYAYWLFERPSEAATERPQAAAESGGARLVDEAPNGTAIFLSRGGEGRARALRDEGAVFAAVQGALRQLGVGLELIAAARDAPSVPARRYERARALIGVHGGAFANLHACAPGMPVIEIVHAERPNLCYAALSTAMRMRYYPYYPLHFPAEQSRTQDDVRVDPDHFAAFVSRALAAS